MKRIWVAFAACSVFVGAGAMAAAVQSQLQKDTTRPCEQINLNANDMATCRTRYAAAKNDSERREVIKFFASGGDQRASDPNSEGHAVSGKDTQHTPSRDRRTSETPPKASN